MSASTEPVTVVITCRIQQGKADIAREEFAQIIKTVVAKETACRGILLHSDPEDPHRLLLIEQWDSKDAFTGPHMQTPHMQAFLQLAETFFAGSPEFGYWREIGSAP